VTLTVGQAVIACLAGVIRERAIFVGGEAASEIPACCISFSACYPPLSPFIPSMAGFQCHTMKKIVTIKCVTVKPSEAYPSRMQ